MRLSAIAAYAGIAALLLIAAAIATESRYDSLHPCDWLRIDTGLQSGLPDAVVKARIQGLFLLRGIIVPGPGECLAEWWRVRRNGLPDGRPDR